VHEHSANAAGSGGAIYLASVAKSAKGVEAAHQALSDIAAKYGMTALMANSIGPSDDFIGAGQSAVWDSKGQLLAQLDEKSVGILVVDTETHQVQAAAP
jgi:predicted amidohydrolase